MDIENIARLTKDLETWQDVKDKADLHIMQSISDLIKEYGVITNDLLIRVGKYSRCRAVVLYRDANNCDLRTAMEAVEKLLKQK